MIVLLVIKTETFTFPLAPELVCTETKVSKINSTISMANIFIDKLKFIGLNCFLFTRISFYD